MGKKNKHKRKRKTKRPPKKGRRQQWTAPICSAPLCNNGSRYIIRARNAPEYEGTFWAACDDCVQMIAAGLKIRGIDADVVSLRALAQIADNAST